MAREIIEIIRGRTTSDGDGVKLTRIFGGRAPERFDPFLLLDEFGSDEARDYIGGFPEHPHRGFETITYMLEGKMRHGDHLGNEGLLDSGDVQWMTAGRGIIHSEMPQQKSGRLHGFQLWLNLPANEKMKPASYRDIKAGQLAQTHIDGVGYKVIAGEINLNGEALQGPISHPITQPLYLEVCFNEAKRINLAIPEGYTTLLYPYQGELSVGEEQQALASGELALLQNEGEVILNAEEGTSLIILAGKPLGEPIAQYGPFVMNTAEEIQQTIEDYRLGQLTEALE